ncbi:hypothetical protein CLF_105468 [Clonorchis sinensis]|uniref:Uncharacterized protein n=1 Tax=Clonorchis sinensis TaxID=79923 RepID=G7YPC2_CLOSI|nr:hypothetical protein CLF_105468 [Clonorchis sinensis]
MTKLAGLHCSLEGELLYTFASVALPGQNPYKHASDINGEGTVKNVCVRQTQNLQVTFLGKFIRKHLQMGGPDAAEVEAMKQELDELRQKVEQLELENSELKRGIELSKEPSSADVPQTEAESDPVN